MLTFKKFPWVSLALLLVAHSTLGWVLSVYNDPWSAWVAVVVGIFFLSMALSSPWSKIRDGFANLLKSDTRVFFIAVTGAFLTVAIATWFHIFAHALVVTSADILFRLDAQLNGLNEVQTFWVLLIVSLAGLGLGGVAQPLI